MPISITELEYPRRSASAALGAAVLECATVNGACLCMEEHQRGTLAMKARSLVREAC